MPYDIYLMTDQPETCRLCGVRTNFEEQSDGMQIHSCPNCCYAYNLENGGA